MGVAPRGRLKAEGRRSTDRRIIVFFYSSVGFRMDYFACRWHHNDGDSPIDLYSEIDDSRWEVRKVECFLDGRMHFADAQEYSGDTRLGEVPLPPLEEIANDPEFSPREIDKAAFEIIWREARRGT